MSVKALLVAVLTGAVLAVAAPAAVAEEVTCTGVIGSVTVDNVRVPDGATCTLDGTRVQGTVYVENDATLRARGVSVIGNVQAENARLVVVRNSSVGGSIQVVQGRQAAVFGTEVNGDILYDENSGELLGGNVQAFQNTGGVWIGRNVIDGNLQCKENNPPPTGGGNVVHGEKEDQCKNL
jgi:hypothetical protein